MSWAVHKTVPAAGEHFSHVVAALSRFSGILPRQCLLQLGDQICKLFSYLYGAGSFRLQKESSLVPMRALGTKVNLKKRTLKLILHFQTPFEPDLNPCWWDHIILLNVVTHQWISVVIFVFSDVVLFTPTPSPTDVCPPCKSLWNSTDWVTSLNFHGLGSLSGWMGLMIRPDKKATAMSQCAQGISIAHPHCQTLSTSSFDCFTVLWMWDWLSKNTLSNSWKTKSWLF